MILYRIVKCQYADLSGTGARLYGGRWNSEGRSMVYLASSRSLATLEALAHLSPTNIPDGFCMMIIDAPDDFAEVEAASLPENWHEFPEPIGPKRLGNDFLAANKNLLLKVPSAIIADEFNYLLNPMHPAASAVKVISNKPFNFDRRLVAH